MNIPFFQVSHINHKLVIQTDSSSDVARNASATRVQPGCRNIPRTILPTENGTSEELRQQIVRVL